MSLSDKGNPQEYATSDEQVYLASDVKEFIKKLRLAIYKDQYLQGDELLNKIDKLAGDDLK